jgi:hypothetical protein
MAEAENHRFEPALDQSVYFSLDVVETWMVMRSPGSTGPPSSLDRRRSHA